MSDKEGSISRSPSRSVSREKSSSGSIKEPSPVPKVYHSRSRSLSRSRSRSRRKISRSPSRGSRRYSRSRSRSRSRRRYRSRSRSNSPYRRRRSRYDRRRGYCRSHSRSPMSNRRRHTGNRDDPNRSRCLGVFGLSLYTQERDLREVFGRYGPVDEVNIVYDHQTGRSRGFAFIYMRNSGDAEEAKEKAPGMEIDGRRIRVDFSITERAHTPTPGIYLGKPTTSTYYRRSASPYSRKGRYSRSRSRSRSYSPRRY